MYRLAIALVCAMTCAAVLVTGAFAHRRSVSPGCNTHACSVRVCKSTTCRSRIHKSTMYPAVASWYGPGLYGNHLACGGTLQPGTAGVAHKTLPCGMAIRLCAVRCITTRVIDRGPYVAGRTFDMTAPVRAAIGAAPVASVRWRPAG